MLHKTSSRDCGMDENTYIDTSLEGTAADSVHLPQRPNLSLATSVPLRLTESQLYTSPQTASTVTPNSLSLSSASAVNSLPSTAATSYSEASPPSASATSKPNAVQNALREVRHFAGGLVSHPYETTKHYTILRHSHGLVFYQGTSTSLAISIFSDTVLPPDRSLWLQSKGYSGKTGMRMKAFVGATGSWLNVTPSMQISAEQLNPSDERAWQRDIAKFRKKAKPEKIREKHQLRETVVLRIPAEAGDGYFAVVLCTGDKKKLCSSPSFRLLSTSTSMHSIRGASLSTLPLELGAMAVNIYATNTIRTIAGPVTSSIQNQVSQFIPSNTQKALEKASSTAYDVSGGKKRVDAYVQSSNDQYEQRLQDSYAPSNYSDVPLDQGPQPPYPIPFTCTSEPVPPIESSSLPTTTLTGVPDYITHQLHGHYFAWVRSIPQKSQDVEAEDWQQALFSALPPSSTQIARANFVAANKRTLTVRLVDPYSSPLPQSRISVLVLGFLRPPTQLPPSTQAASDEAILLEEANDIAFAQGVLDHPAFSPEAVEQGKEKPGMKKKYADMRTQIDRVPLHKLGVRTDSDKMKERGIVVGGFYILR